MAFDVAAWWANSTYNVTNLSQLRVAYVDDLLFANVDVTTWNGTLCPAASQLLPLSNFDSLEPVLAYMYTEPDVITLPPSVWNPATLDVGLLDLQNFQQQFFPPALQRATVGEVANWWINSTQNDAGNMTTFIIDILGYCGGYFCQLDTMQVGNPDIVGIGMLFSVVSLMILSLLFTLLSVAPVGPVIKNKHPFPAKTVYHRILNRVVGAFLGTIDHLFEAVIVFGLAVLVTSWIYRYRTTSRFDALMADALAMLCSTTIIMLLATYYDFSKEKPHWSFTALIVSVMTIVLFATHFDIVDRHASALELACGIGEGQAWTTVSLDGDPFDKGGFQFLPMGFAFWLLTLGGALAHQPWVRRWFQPTHPPGARVAYRIAESLPLFFGMGALSVYAAYFWNAWHVMANTYGPAFTQAETTWGFGQLLALFTWLPPLMTFMHALFAGLERMLLARLPQGWVAHFTRQRRKEDGAPAEVQPETEQPSMFARFKRPRPPSASKGGTGTSSPATHVFTMPDTWDRISFRGVEPYPGA